MKTYEVRLARYTREEAYVIVKAPNADEALSLAEERTDEHEWHMDDDYCETYHVETTRVENA